MPYIKGYQQRLEEQAQEQNAQVDPKDQAKIQAMLMQQQTRNQIAEQNAELDRKLKAIAFQQDQAIKAAQAKADIAGQDLKTASEIIRGNAKATADAAAKSKEPVSR